jgi:hypothetical protein
MRSLIALLLLGLILVISVTTSAFADYTLVGKIPAPQPCPQSCPVTGLASAGDNLFATVVYDTISFTYLLRPSDGMMLDMYAWVRPPGQDNYYYFDAAAYEGDLIYWVADASGADLLRFEFDDATVTLLDTLHSDRIIAPSGLAWQYMLESIYDGLWVADSEWDSLFLLETSGDILGAYSLSGIPFMGTLNPTSVTRSGENLFFTSGVHPDSLFEASQTAERVYAHYLPDLWPLEPLAATFHGDLLYVAGYGDSIYVYSTGSYSDPVPAGDSVVVHVIPDELDVGFTHVAEAGSLYVEVTPTQSCPPPEDVEFFGDFYDISTTATFEYLTKVALTSLDFPQGIDPKDVRVFVRPSGECQTWRDATVEIIDIEEPRSPVLARSGKRLSEEDEFSVFAFGEDNRRITEVIALKYDYLDSAITQNQNWIPEDEYNRMQTLLSASRLAYALRRYRLAARGANRIANIARTTPEIPHTYDPMAAPGGNVAGRIISRAHTLAFSLSILLKEQQMPGPMEAAWKKPPINIVGDAPDRFVAAPNPSKSEFMISFNAPAGRAVSVKVYSVEGELVRTLVRGARVEGAQSVVWDGRNDQGVPVAAGAYFAVLEVGEERSVRKMVLQR